MKQITFAILFAALLMIGCTQQEGQPKHELSFALSYDTTYVIHPFMTDSGQILMMPSYWDKKKLVYKKNTDAPYAAFDSNQIKGIKIVRSNLPTVHIQTESGSMEYLNSAKSNQESGVLTVWNVNGFMECREAIQSIHGRGSCSWWGDKKPYGIKLKKKAQMLGLKKAKKFTLLSQYYDYSGLRNWLVFFAAKQLGLPNLINCSMANVYFNGHYGGCYLITNKVDIHKSGVDIHDSEKDEKKEVSGGFLMEIDYREKALRYSPSVFPTKHGGNMIIKSPKYASEEQMQYIKSLWGTVEEALISYSEGSDENELDTLIDLPSFVNNYLCQEVFMNLDAGTNSFYLYKDWDRPSYSKIIAAPLWDFDMSIHSPNSALVGAELSDVIYAGAGTFPDSIGYNGVFGALYKSAHFRQMVADRYLTDMRPIVADLMWGATWDSIYSTIKTDMETDNLRWWGENHFSSECKQMQEWMKRRLAYLDQVWISDSTEERCQVYLKITHTGFHHLLLYSVPKGEKFNQMIPEFNKKAQGIGIYKYDFTGWSIDGEPVMLDTLHVQHDLIIKSRWELAKEPTWQETTKLRLHSYKQKILSLLY